MHTWLVESFELTFYRGGPDYLTEALCARLQELEEMGWIIKTVAPRGEKEFAIVAYR